MSNMSEPAVVVGSDHVPLEIHLAADWGIVAIKEWLIKVTRDEKYRILWDEFFKNHFQVSQPDPEGSGEAGQPAGISLRLKHGPDGVEYILNPIDFTMSIYGHEMTVKMYSSWDALAVILNCRLPRYEPAVGPAKGYALKINVLFAKWSKLMSGCLAPNKFYPPVYCVSFTEIQRGPTPKTSQMYIFLLSVGKVVDLETGTPELGRAHTRVVEMLVNARRDQALPRGLFDAEDNPLTILLEDGRLPTNPDDLKTRFKRYSLSSRKPVTEKTLEEFCMKWKPSNSPCKNYVGACAETWGFQLMLQILGSGDCYYSIALGQGSKGLNSIKLGPGYRYSRSKVNGSKITKGTCSACLYVVCAIKAGFNITMDEITDADITDILDTENSNPVLTTMQAEPPAKGGGLNLLGYFSSKLAR